MRKKVTKKKTQKRSSSTGGYYLCGTDFFENILSTGYTSLASSPDIVAGVNKIAAIVSSMPIHLMENQKNGDVRIDNGLARKIDIDPNQWMTRQKFIQAIVRTLLLEGDGNSDLVVQTKDGYIQNIIPLPASMISLIPDGWGYYALVNGVRYNPDELIHIAINTDPRYPWKGSGAKVSLQTVAKSLAQADATKTGFMQSKWRPSIIVKVDSTTDALNTPDTRKAILQNYFETQEAGEPWLLPADTFDVTTVQPLSLTDLALKDGMELDKRTVASVLDVPSFVLGVGTFNAEEWNNFVNTRIKSICQAIEQAFTQALVLNPKWYFRFDNQNLLSYDLVKSSTVSANYYAMGLMTGNEVRHRSGLSPMAGLDGLVMLENYIPVDKLGDQNKLKGDSNG